MNIPLQSTEPTPPPASYNLQTAVSKIKDVVEEIKQNGIDMQLNELDFDKSYQIIIKINKD